jgi:RecA/RadA recombinase
MASKLTDRLLKNVKKNGLGNSLKDSEFSKIDYYISMKSVILNLLFSAKWNGGIPSGRISMPAGGKSLGKSQIAYDVAKQFQSEGGTIVLFDSEFASEEKALTNLGLDVENIIYFPLTNIHDEDKAMSMTYQLKQLMNDIERGDKVLLIFDSMGGWMSQRTINNAEKGNTAKDMSIAQDKKGFLGLINSLIGLKGIPCIVLNHNYANVGGFGAQTEVSGGGALFWPSSVVEITSKAKLKIDDIDVGMVGTAKVYKGRLSREKSVGKFAMHSEYGFLPFYGLDEYAIEGGYIEETKDGRSTVYMFKDKDDNEYKCPKKFYMMPEHYSFWGALFKHTDYGEFLNDLFSYGSNKKLNSLKLED